MAAAFATVQGALATVAFRPMLLNTGAVQTDGAFAARFRLALQAIGSSRGSAASRLGVDKSLVGRWAAGTVHPTEHNLARITALIAEHVPGFTLLDWQRNLDGFAARLGIEPALAAKATPGVSAPLFPLLDQGRAETARRGSTYEGFWRSTRPSLIMHGALFHDHGMIRKGASGLLEARMGGAGLTFHGSAYPAEGNLFVILEDPVGCTPVFLIFRGVPLPKATMLDGIFLIAALDAGRTPAAMPMVLERIGDLSGDAAADDARCRELGMTPPAVDESQGRHWAHDHLLRNIGPLAAAQGGDLFLTASAAAGISRGTTASGELQG